MKSVSPKARLFLAVIFLLILVGAYSRRPQISAIIWHWKHGDIVRVGDYSVPVPRQWIVENEASVLSYMIDTRNSRISSVMIDSMPTATPNLEFWRDSKQSWLKNKGMRNPEVRSFDFEDEVVSCVGGHEFLETMKISGAEDVVSVDCRTSGKLHLMFVGQRADIEVLYSLLPKIRKQR